MNSESSIFLGRDIRLQYPRMAIEDFKKEVLRLTTVETNATFHGEWVGRLIGQRAIVEGFGFSCKNIFFLFGKIKRW